MKSSEAHPAGAWTPDDPVLDYWWEREQWGRCDSTEAVIERARRFVRSRWGFELTVDPGSGSGSDAEHRLAHCTWGTRTLQLLSGSAPVSEPAALAARNLLLDLRRALRDVVPEPTDRAPGAALLKEFGDMLSDTLDPTAFTAGLQRVCEDHLGLDVEGMVYTGPDDAVPVGFEEGAPPIRFDDADPYPRTPRRKGKCVLVPVQFRGEVVAVIVLASPEERDSGGARLLQHLSTLLGDHLRAIRDRLIARPHQQFQIDNSLVPDAESLPTDQGLDGMLDAFTQVVQELFDCDHCRLFWRDPDDFLRLRSCSPEDLSDEVRVPIGQDPQIQTVIEENRAVLTNNLPAGPGLPDHSGTVRSFLAVPFRAGGRVLGTLNLSSENPRIFTADIVERISHLCDQVATVYGVSRELAALTSYVDDILSNLPVGVMHCSYEERTLHANGMATRLLGLPRPELTLEGFERFAADRGFPEGFTRFCLETPDGTDTGSRDFKLGDDPPRTRILEGTRAPLRDLEREVTGVLVVLSDVTDQRMLRQRMDRNERLSALGELASSLAHEIKNPLTSIQGFVQLMSERSDDETFLRRTGRVLEKETRRLNELAENLLSFGKPQIETREPVPVRSLLRDVHLLVKKRLEGQDVEWNCSVPEALRVHGDPMNLKQVLLNLVLNALDAMKQGGTLRIEGGKEPGGGVALSVRDTGSGIPDEVREKLFNPFFTTKQEGTGLGLAICHRIVQEHGGRIRVESVPGQGTTVQLHFPARSGPSPLRAKGTESL